MLLVLRGASLYRESLALARASAVAHARRTRLADRPHDLIDTPR